MNRSEFSCLTPFFLFDALLAGAFFRLSGWAESAVGFGSAIPLLRLARRAMFFLRRVFKRKNYAAREQNARHCQKCSYFSHYFSDHLFKSFKKQPTPHATWVVCFNRTYLVKVKSLVALALETSTVADCFW
jgi:hypothetical protein